MRARYTFAFYEIITKIFDIFSLAGCVPGDSRERVKAKRVSRKLERGQRRDATFLLALPDLSSVRHEYFILGNAAHPKAFYNGVSLRRGQRDGTIFRDVSAVAKKNAKKKNVIS